jgi:hypothetical protein
MQSPLLLRLVDQLIAVRRGPAGGGGKLTVQSRSLDKALLLKRLSKVGVAARAIALFYQ